MLDAFSFRHVLSLQNVDIIISLGFCTQSKFTSGIHEKSALRRCYHARASQAALEVSVDQTCGHGIE